LIKNPVIGAIISIRFFIYGLLMAKALMFFGIEAYMVQVIILFVLLPIIFFADRKFCKLLKGE
jgi:Zn-dependent membrane protease YugP